MTNEEASKILRDSYCERNLSRKELMAVEKAFRVLEQEPCEDCQRIYKLNPYYDCISRQDAIDKMWEELDEDTAYEVRDILEVQPSVVLKQEPCEKWIPLKTRPMTDEESTYYRDWAEYGAEIFDCPLPDDGQEVLVSWGGNVCIDTFFKEYDGCYFEGVDIDDVDAWQPLPEPYKAERNDKE